jgi:hypothetical protein
VTTKTLTADAQRYDRRKLTRLQYNETMSKWLVSVALTAVLATGCSFGNSAQTCSSDQQCQSGTSPGGRCEPGFGLCSFTDTVCPSGRRFGGLSGDKSGACVGGSAPIVDAAIDAQIDAAIDAPPDAQACFGTAPFTICLRNAPTSPVLFAGLTSIDTATSPLCAATVSGGDGYCVIAGTSITINAGIDVQAVGSKPLVLLASDSITTGLLSTIDVGSHRPTQIVGAGADPTSSCDAGTAPTTNNGTSGGGAGGSFTGPGGKGGTGSSANPGAGGTPGAIVTAPVTTLRGGCPGQAGAGANASGGHGGGAVMLIAGSSITVNGNVNASGESGGGGLAGFTGGGGGGAGGMIVFDAPFITATSLVIANGGGGGEGGNQFQTGQAGTDPSDIGQANGGGNIPNGGNGGRGAGGTASAEAAADGTGGNNGGGGGGGGGGTGLIKAPANAVLGTQVSPPPTR